MVWQPEPYRDPSPTWYRGIELRSRCEADAIAMLDSLLTKHFGFDVWDKNFFKYEGSGYRNRSHFYKPDWIFTWPSDENQRTFFEIKPDIEGLNPVDLLDRMHCVRDTNPTAELVLLIGTWDRQERQYYFPWPPHWRCSPPSNNCFKCQPAPPPRAVRIEDLL